MLNIIRSLTATKVKLSSWCRAPMVAEDISALVIILAVANLQEWQTGLS